MMPEIEIREIAQPFPRAYQIQKTEIVLIDDDSMIHDLWKMGAESQSVGLKSYFRVSDFLADSTRYPSTTPIYVDSDLGDEKPGEVLSKEIADRGFERIFIATAKTWTDRTQFPWLSGVVDKDFPLRNH